MCAIDGFMSRADDLETLERGCTRTSFVLSFFKIKFRAICFCNLKNKLEWKAKKSIAKSISFLSFIPLPKFFSFAFTGAKKAFETNIFPMRWQNKSVSIISCPVRRQTVVECLFVHLFHQIVFREFQVSNFFFCWILIFLMFFSLLSLIYYCFKFSFFSHNHKWNKRKVREKLDENINN